MVDFDKLIEEATDVVYAHPELTVWEKIRNLFGYHFPKRGYIKPKPASEVEEPIENKIKSIAKS